MILNQNNLSEMQNKMIFVSFKHYTQISILKLCFDVYVYVQRDLFKTASTRFWTDSFYLKMLFGRDKIVSLKKILNKL